MEHNSHQEPDSCPWLPPVFQEGTVVRYLERYLQSFFFFHKWFHFFVIADQSEKMSLFTTKLIMMNSSLAIFWRVSLATNAFFRAVDTIRFSLVFLLS